MQSLRSLLEENEEPTKGKQLGLLWLIIRANSVLKGPSSEQKARGHSDVSERGAHSSMEEGICTVCLSFSQAWEMAAPCGSPAHLSRRAFAFQGHCDLHEGSQSSPVGAALGREVILTGASQEARHPGQCCHGATNL